MPVVVWAIASGEMRCVPAVLGGGDQRRSRRLSCQALRHDDGLGAYLDPLADKVLIVSIYLTLGFNGIIRAGSSSWVSRDIMIVGAVMLSWLVDKPVALKPLAVSKLNTVAQIVLALVVLGALGFKFDAEVAIVMLTALVAALTLLSIAFYVAEWVRHMNAAEPRH